MRRSAARPGRSPGGATRSTWTSPTVSAPVSSATGPRSWCTWRPGPTSTAARSIRISPSVATGWRPGSSPRHVPPVARTSWSSRPTRCSMGPARTGSRTCRPIRSTRVTRTAPPRPRVSGSPRSPSRACPVACWGSPGRPGCSGAPGGTSRAGSSMPRSARRRPANRSGSSTTSGEPRHIPRTSPTRSWTCSRTTRSPGRTTSSTAGSGRGRTGHATSSVGRALT